VRCSLKTPTRWGIEWNNRSLDGTNADSASLGKLIEWKLENLATITTPSSSPPAGEIN